MTEKFTKKILREFLGHNFVSRLRTLKPKKPNKPKENIKNLKNLKPKHFYKNLGFSSFDLVPF